MYKNDWTSGYQPVMNRQICPLHGYGECITCILVSYLSFIDKIAERKDLSSNTSDPTLKKVTKLNDPNGDTVIHCKITPAAKEIVPV